MRSPGAAMSRLCVLMTEMVGRWRSFPRAGDGDSETSKSVASLFVSIGRPVIGSLNRAHVWLLPTLGEYVVWSTTVVPWRSWSCTFPFGSEFFGRTTERYSSPDPQAPRFCVVNVKMTVTLPPLFSARFQPFREIGVAVGFASSTHSGFGWGETSLMTAFVAACAAMGNRATAASGNATSYPRRQSEAK